MKAIDILIVDDNVIFREGLAKIIGRDSDINVVGCVENAKEALKFCSKILPDLILMDIKMPVCDGVKGTKLIKDKYNSIKIIILTTFADEEYISGALKNGADGYVFKDTDGNELTNIIKSTMKGYSIIKQDVLRSIRKQYKIKKNNKGKMDPSISICLNCQEKKVLQLIVEGKNNKEIAEELKLAEGSIRNLVSVMLEKFNLKNRTQLAIFAVKNDII